MRSTATNGGDGLSTDSSSSTFPDNADTGTNYWVDVSFTPQPAPGAASNVTATAGYSSATLAWSAPTTGGPATSYTITPYVAGVAQPTTTVTGSPAPTTATVPGLTNGTSYTFTVTASNPAGSAAASAPSNAVTPSATAPPVFVQQAGTQAASVKSISIQPSRPVTASNRLVVEVAAWKSSAPNVTGVTDSAGDTFTQLSSTTAPDGTVLTVWTAVVTYSGGTRPTITATTSAASDLGITALEYAGLSTANGDRRPRLVGQRQRDHRVQPRPPSAPGRPRRPATRTSSPSASTPTRASATPSPPGPDGRCGPSVSPVNTVEVLARGPVAQQRRHGHGHGRHRRQHALGADRPAPQARLGDTADGAERAQRRHGHRGQRLGDGELDRTRQRREPHHLLHGHALRRVDRRHTGDRRQPEPERLDHDHRAHQRDHLHVHGERHQQRRHERPVRALQRRHAAGAVLPGGADRRQRGGR